MKNSLRHFANPSPKFYRGYKVRNLASIFDLRHIWNALVSKRSNISKSQRYSNERLCWICILAKFCIVRFTPPPLRTIQYWLIGALVESSITKLQIVRFRKNCTEFDHVTMTIIGSAVGAFDWYRQWYCWTTLNRVFDLCNVARPSQQQLSSCSRRLTEIAGVDNDGVIDSIFKLQQNC